MGTYRWTGIGTLAGFGLGTIVNNTLMPLFYKRIIDIVSTSSPTPALGKELFTIVAIIAGLGLLAQTLYRLGEFAVIYFESNVMRSIYNDSFERLIRHSYGFFADSFAGSLVAKTKRLVRSFMVMFDTFTFSFWTTSLIAGTSIIVLFTFNWLLGLILLSWVIVYTIITIIFIRFKMHYDLEEAKADSRITAQLADVIGNVLNLKIFASRRREIQLYRTVTQDEYEHRNRAWHFANLQYAVQGFLMLLGEVVAMYVVVKLWIAGTVTAGTIVLMQAYFVTIMIHVWDLGKAMTRFAKSASDAAEMIDIFEVPIEITDPKQPEQVAITKGHVVFDNVDFTYNEGTAVFKNFTLDIPAGQKVGLVGHSGSGKSTLTKVLLRFADVGDGAVTIDGQDIRNIRQDDLRAHISYVPQEPLLFHRTIRENIAYGKPTASLEEVKAAAQQAHAHEFIESLQHGYDTFVGERGVKLSGGERQRVAIARAMLKDAPIIMLDEATSSLDSISESYIQKALENLTQGKTTIVIAHRLSTVQQMDRILVLADGEIVEEGTHSELIAKKGAYFELWQHQSNGFIS